MANITKKCWPEYFEKIRLGDKTFELRLADFPISSGDTLTLKEWDPKTNDYTGRELIKKVGYVGKWKLDQLFWSKVEIEKHGLQVISLLD